MNFNSLIICGLMSDVTYPFISGTSVARDFVELPSQLYEHWLTVPEVLSTHARHYETGEPMPMELVERLIAAEKFNQGFKTVEFTASAIVDLELHRLTGSGAQQGARNDAIELLAGAINIGGASEHHRESVGLMEAVQV